ncbi:MAG TPA: hypothetical protein DIS79_02030 [Bacteroidetes bacterium]|nr:hypothetical protein [Bacteroidota bacterium]
MVMKRNMTGSATMIGIHLIAIPGDNQVLDVEAVGREIEHLAHTTAVIAGCTCSAVHVRPDHVHVLIAAAAEESVGSFIPRFLDVTSQFIRSEQEKRGDTNGFFWDDGVHVTLLPPWHLEILASFVRDQDRFHERKSLQEEIDEVFMPNAAEPPRPKSRNGTFRPS